jgi:hypothetical protein
MGACQGMDSNTKKLTNFVKTGDIYNNISGGNNKDNKKVQNKEFLIQGNELKLNEHMSNDLLNFRNVQQIQKRAF